MMSLAQIAQTLAQLRQLHIGTPRDEAFAHHLDRLLSRDGQGNFLPQALPFTRTGETRGIMVIDGPGGGKSTLVSHGLDRHPALKVGPEGRKPYLASIVPSPATFKSMTLELLAKTGYTEVGPRREAWSTWQVFRGRLADFGYCLVWIDEAHDLFCADRNLILRAIKTLMQGDGAVIVILSGTDSLFDIVRSDPQVQRRFSTLTLPPVSLHHDVSSFEDLLIRYCAKAGLEAPNEVDLIERLFHASRYRFGRCIETIISAIEEALMTGARQLEINHFAAVWEMQEGCGMDKNVFWAPDYRALYPDAPAQMGAVSNRRQRA